MSMGSMVAASLAPAGGGTDEGLPEELRPPMFAARRRALRRRAEEEERGKYEGGGKCPLPLPFIAGSGGSSDRMRPRSPRPAMVTAARRAPCRAAAVLIPFTAITTRAVCEEAACVAETHSST